MTWDAIVLGAGAAGMFAAAEAAKRGRRVLVLDHAAKPGEKIRISGGGRCNFTNLHARPETFLSENPRFAASALSRYTPLDFVALLEAHGLGWHEKALGQLFCEQRAGAVVTMLLTEMGDAGATLRLSEPVERVERVEAGFRVYTASGAEEAAALVIATGGKSIPKMGATGFAYDLARQFGLAVTETRPALVPFTLPPVLLERLRPLVGVAAEAEVTGGGATFAEGMLFTHRGLSGPAMLQVSSFWREGQAIRVAFGGREAALAALKAARAEGPKRALRTALAAFLPKALADWIEAEAGEQRPLAELSDKRLAEIAAFVSGWEVKPTGTEGYRTAEVTLGGVSTGALDGKTLAARAVPGLHFIGECVDMTGWLGGYNFQWAWASGFAAGRAV